ncbi:hypothetical protein [Streptomyces lydicus]|uniref:hypothetical protein n=1 Tax=Streptomyces lydicus TaxID=47763 RepID=UPI00379472E9
MDLSLTKMCRGCRRELPRDVAHFYRAPDNKDGLRTKCVACVRAEEKQRYDANPERVLQRKRERYAERAAMFSTMPHYTAA